MIPSMLDQVIAARIPTPTELRAATKREESMQLVLDALRRHGNLTVMTAEKLTGKSRRMCAEYLAELEKRGFRQGSKKFGRVVRAWLGLGLQGTEEDDQ